MLKPSHLQTEAFVFTGQFPGILLTPAEADALEWVLSKQFWWSTDAAEFPQLVVCSREYALTDILQRIIVNYAWAEWTLFDKFCCLVIALAAAIPFLNIPNAHKLELFNVEKQWYLQRLFSDLKTLIEGDRLTAHPEDSPSEPEDSEDPELASPDLVPLDLDGFSPPALPQPEPNIPVDNALLDLLDMSDIEDPLPPITNFTDSDGSDDTERVPRWVTFADFTASLDNADRKDQEDTNFEEMKLDEAEENAGESEQGADERDQDQDQDQGSVPLPKSSRGLKRALLDVIGEDEDTETRPAKLRRS
jgi:hypothetical protein